MQDFLSAIWGEGPFLGELRTMRAGSHPEQAWYPLSNLKDVEDHARLADSLLADVYYGVVPRARQGGTAADCVSTTTVLWADVDAKHTGGKHPALTGIRRAAQTPSIIVDSGHGYHAYWLLREPASFEVANAAMRVLAREVQGDAVYDQARILRVPGTTNRKAEPLVPVRIIYWDVERKYRSGDFDTLPSTSSPAFVAGRTGRQQRLDLPSWLEEKLNHPAAKGSRSEAVFSACLWLYRYGWDADAIASEIIDSPLGEKYHEKGQDGPRWLKATIRAAMRAADE